METGEAIVAVAGPIMNFILAIVFSLIYAAIYKFVPSFTLTQVRLYNLDNAYLYDNYKFRTWNI